MYELPAYLREYVGVGGMLDVSRLRARLAELGPAHDFGGHG